MYTKRKLTPAAEAASFWGDIRHDWKSCTPVSAPSHPIDAVFRNPSPRSSCAMPRRIFAPIRFPILQQPAVLFFLGLEQAQQHFFHATGPSRLQLFLKAGFQGRVSDLDIHHIEGNDAQWT